MLEKYDGWLVGVGSMSEDQNAANPLRQIRPSEYYNLGTKGKSITISPLSLADTAGRHDNILISCFF